VSCTDDLNTHASTHDEIPENQVGPLPFVGKLQGESFKELSSFPPDQIISGDDNRSEVLALFKTGLQVVLKPGNKVKTTQ
jgi:hypothetical protein